MFIPIKEYMTEKEQHSMWTVSFLQLGHVSIQ